MKKTILLCLILNLTVISAIGQHLELPKTKWQDYGFQKQVEQVATGYYKRDSVSYAPNMLEVYTFNKEGNLIQKYIRMFGKYESATAHNYVYNNGILDSINIIISPQNFNTKQKIHYNASGKLDSITASGSFSNFTETFTYHKNETLNFIERKHKNGGTNQAFFNLKKNYVLVNEIDLKGNITKNNFIYDGDQLFASITLKDSIVTFHNAFHRTDFKTKVSGDALDYTLNWRDLKHKNNEEFQKEISELQYSSSSRIILEIPIETTNEDGEWIKRLQIDKRYGYNKQYVFKSIVYLDGTISGSADYDLMFEMKASDFEK